MKRERIPIILLVVIFSLSIVGVAIAAAGSAREPVSLPAATEGPVFEDQEYLFSVSPFDDLISQVNPYTGITVVGHQLFASSKAISGVNGLATHPGTGELYGVVKLFAGGKVTRELATINPFSGEVKAIGKLKDKFAGLAFDSAGTLYGVTGDGAVVSETIYTINTTNANTTFLIDLTKPMTGSDGESLGYNPVDGLLYRGSGHTGISVIFESIDPTPPHVRTSIPITSELQEEEATALTWWDDMGKFLWVQGHSGYTNTLFTVTSDGIATKVGAMDHNSKGLAWASVSGKPEPGLYGSSVDGKLFLLDLKTGAGTLIGQLPGFGSTELEYDNMTGSAYNQSPNGDFFAYEIDIRSGMPVTGPINNDAAHTGMEYVGNILYTTFITGPRTSTLGQLDPSTGISTPIGYTGVGPISGLAYDEENDIMYGVSGGGSMPLTQGTLYTINLTSGVALTVGKTITKAGSLQFGQDGDLYAGTGASTMAGNLYKIDPATGAYELVGDSGMGSIHGLTLVKRGGEVYLPIVIKD